MRIDKERVRQAFDAYVEAYDRSDEKIRLKIEHTQRVSELCGQIAESLALSGEDVELAWLIGMLHDIGRFEQLRRFGTFIDAESVDHAALGAQILFEQGMIREYVDEDGEDALLEAAVAYHSAFRVPEGMDGRTERFCHIIRDADKIDILKVNVDFPLEEIYNVPTQELRSGEVTAEVLESFKEEHAVLRSLKKTAVDHVVGHISLVFELMYPASFRIVREQGYMDKLLHFESWNSRTKEQFAVIRERMARYVEKRAGSFGVYE